MTQDWLTGFDNKDRVEFLQHEIAHLEVRKQELKFEFVSKRAKVDEIQQLKVLWQQLQNIEFEQIDAHQIEQSLLASQEKLKILTSPDSNLSMAKAKLNQAEEKLKKLSAERDKYLKLSAGLEGEFKHAQGQKNRAYKKAEVGLKEAQRNLAQGYFPQVKEEHINELPDIEKGFSEKLQKQIDGLKSKQEQLEKTLIRHMLGAQKEDRGALSEVGSELEDAPKYLDRLKTLIEEALPEKRQRFKDYLNRSSDEGVTQLLMTIDSEVERIEDKLEDLNATLRRVDFQPGRYLQLVSGKVMHESLRSFNRTRAKLASARFIEDEGESQYKVLQDIVALLRNACEKSRTLAAKALLDPRFRLEFKVSVIDRTSTELIETRSGSQGGSGGEKEIIASYVLTASLSYALCPDGSSRPLFGTIVLDEAFSRSSHAVAGRIIAALREFGLHALFITPNKEMKLLRKHTRSAVVVHRRGIESSLTPLSWQELDDLNKKRREAR